MKVHLTTAYPRPEGAPDNQTCRWLCESARVDPFREHEIIDDPATADLILFAEEHPDEDPYLFGVRNHPIYRLYRDKCVLYHDTDFAVPLLRGIYPSILRRDYQPDRCRSGPYLTRQVPNEAIRYDPAPSETKWLYAFLGAANSPVRRALLTRPHPRGYVRDTTGQFLWRLAPGVERETYISEYAQALRSSCFALCPAGLGPSTYRLYEAMEMGRAPVIFADQWVAPSGPDWEQFSLRLPESRITDFESELTTHNERHVEMGRLARAAWEQWFAPAVAFHRTVETARELVASRPSLLSSLRAWSTLARPPHLRNWARFSYRSFLTRRNNPRNGR